MPNDTVLVIAGNVLAIEREFTPAEVGFDARDVQSILLRAGNVLDCRGFSDFMLTVVIDNTGSPTTGLYRVNVDLYNDADVNILSAFQIIGSAGNLKADNTLTVTWGQSNTAKAYGTGSAGLSASADILRFGAKMKISIDTYEVHNGTSVTATCYLRART